MKTARQKWIVLFSLFLLTGCQHQPEEISLLLLPFIRSSRLKIRKIRNSQNKTQKSLPIWLTKW